MEQVVDALGSLSAPLTCALVAAVLFLESAALAGVVVPGTAALLIGGVLSGSGHVAAEFLLVTGVLAPIVGDSVGYARGRRSGRRHTARRIRGEAWDRAEALVARREAAAVLAGRRDGLLRRLVPITAGASGVSYRSFLGWSAVGALVWSSIVIATGYVLGLLWQQVAVRLNEASVIGGGLLVLAAVLALVAHWSVHHVANGGPRLTWVTDSAPVRSMRYRLESVVQRSGPVPAAVKLLAVGGAVLGACTVLLTKLFDDVLEGDGIAQLDHPVLTWLMSHRDDDLTNVMIAVTNVGGTVAMAVAAAAVAVWCAWKRHWRTTALVVITTLGAGALVKVGKAVVGRPRPPRAGQLVIETNQSFPSGHALGSIVVIGLLTALALFLQRRWPARAWTLAAAVFTVFLVGFSRLYLAVHWPTDVLGGWLVGGAWLVLCLTTAAVLRSRRANGMPSSEPADLADAEESGTGSATTSAAADHSLRSS
jgi:undecaprenyl-diphosphatase